MMDGRANAPSLSTATAVAMSYEGKHDACEGERGEDVRESVEVQRRLVQISVQELEHVKASRIERE